MTPASPLPSASIVPAWPPSTGHHPAAEILRELQNENARLRRERDSLADEVGQTFEELHCLRRMATDLSNCGVARDVRSLADQFLPTLGELVRAKGMFLAFKQERDDTAAPHVLPRYGLETIVAAGDRRIPPAEILQLTEQFEKLELTEPVVFNRDSGLKRPPIQTRARNVVAVPLMHQKSNYGWLIATDRIATRSASPDCPTGLRGAEFGSREVGLLTTAAALLAGHLRNAQLFRAEQNLRVDVIETITGALDARDPYTCGHSRRVAQYAVRIAERMGFTSRQCERLYVTGLLHDVGKIGVPDEILQKPGGLTDAEFDVIKQHPTIGHAILSPLRALSFVLPGVLHHHERMDGKGYPHGLSESEIPVDAKILAVADGYDAMTSNRAYRPGMPVERAVQILLDGRGDQWDRDAVDTFVGALPASAMTEPARSEALLCHPGRDKD